MLVSSKLACTNGWVYDYENNMREEPEVAELAERVTYSICPIDSIKTVCCPSQKDATLELPLLLFAIKSCTTIT